MAHAQSVRGNSPTVVALDLEACNPMDPLPRFRQL